MDSSKGVLERALDVLMKEELRKLNLHLPKRRRSLGELLREDEPSVEAIGGGRIVLERDELMRLAEEIPESFHDEIMLPFIIMRRMDLGRSVYTISGSRVEEFTLKRLLGLSAVSFESMDLDREPLYLYKPHISQLMRRFHSLIVIGFGLPKEWEF